MFAPLLAPSRGRVFRTARVYHGGHLDFERPRYFAPAHPLFAQPLRLSAPEYALWAPEARSGLPFFDGRRLC
jgi:hypothetical protein